MRTLFRVLINLGDMCASHSLKELVTCAGIELGICDLENKEKTIIRCTLESIPIKHGMVETGKES
jgi:hypothetical protein